MNHICPNCSSKDVSEEDETCTFPYGVAPLQVLITVVQPVMVCFKCDEEWTDHRSEDARETAIALYKSVFNAQAQAEIEALKKRIKGYEVWEQSVNDALNSGDGSYRP